VILASNITAIILQTLSAKLGIATGRDLAQLCRQEYPRWVRLPLWGTAEVAMMATDLAEFMGAAIGIHLLFGIPLTPAVFITALDVFLVLWLSHYGYRAFETVIVGFVAIIGFCYVYELFLARPSVGKIVYHLFVPHMTKEAVFVAIGILGATVMPHNVYLHSALSQYRKTSEAPAEKRKLFRFATLDTVIALNGALFVNAAILIMSAEVFGSRGLKVATIQEAHSTLTPLLGPASSMAFAIALLASGLSSSTTGTLAGQVVMEGFLNLRMRPWLRRLITRVLTMIPVLVAVSVGYEPLLLLVWSQVILSFQLPFATIPLILFTSRKDLMGEFVNRPITKGVAWFLAGCIVLFNAILLYLFFTGQS
jgi:manganese transport protein